MKRFLDSLDEAVLVIWRRPGRSLLTAIGVLLGVGLFVGSTTAALSAQADIRATFDELRARELTITGDIQLPGATAFLDVEDRLLQAQEVVAAGVIGSLGLKQMQIPFARASSSQEVIVATRGAFSAIQADLAYGRLFTSFEEKQGARVVVLGSLLANSFRTERERLERVVIDGIDFMVIGELDDVARENSILFSAIVPPATAQELWGGVQTAKIIAFARPGLTRQAAAVLPLAVNPTSPETIEVTAPPDATTLGIGVDERIQELIRLLSASLLFAGTAVIAGSTLISAIERRKEFGIRRAIGWNRSQVALLLVAESSAVTWVATAIGASLALVFVSVLGGTRDWILVIDWRSFWLAVVVGAIAGPVAGLWPGLRAASVNPIEAIRE
jgi:putative ABC transport system permease protein